MKKLVILCVAVFMGCVSYAQLSFDARVGAVLSSISESSLKLKFGAKAGLGIDYAFSELVAIRSGLFFSMKGASDAETPFDFSSENSLKLNYLDVPLLASFRIHVAKKFGISLNAGPSVSYLISKKPENLATMNSIDVGANMGLDFVFNKKFIIGAEAQYGLPKLSKDIKQHNISYSLMFGYRF